MDTDLFKLMHCPSDQTLVSPPTKLLEHCQDKSAPLQSCQTVCNCTADRTADCRHRSLTDVPQDLPRNIIEINLSHNRLKLLPATAFTDYKNLRKIIIDNNHLKEVDENAFSGLNDLSSLYMSSNNLKALPPGLFSRLRSLKILYLHQNQIACIQRETFSGLKNLQILHLSDNQVRSLPSGCFSDLKRLQYLYLVNNPIVCDCRISWLPEYLVQKEAGGVQWAQCAEPRELHGEHIRSVAPTSLRCNALSQYLTASSVDCELSNHFCPEGCTCRQTLPDEDGDPLYTNSKEMQGEYQSPSSTVGIRVDCSYLGLTEVPANLPRHTKELNLRNNLLTGITNRAIFSSLIQLETLILDSNSIQSIDNEIFSQNQALRKLILSNNSLTSFDHRILSGLAKLEVLLLQHNQISCLNRRTFSQTPALKILMLNNNKLRCITKGVFDGMSLHSLSLSANPLKCDCHLSWLPDWLRDQTVAEPLPPTCVEPEELAGTPVASLSRYHFTCVKKCSADTLSWHSQRGLDETDKEVQCQGVCCREPKAVATTELNNDCPEKCLCDSNSVYCSDLNLTEIPLHIPVETRQLYLERNHIKNIIPTQLDHLAKLHTLVLSYNRLVELQTKLFEKLVNLKTLVLSHNNIQCIHPEAFKGLRGLRVLILQGNNISLIPYGTFSELQQLSNLALGQNPLHCDCNSKWLNSFFRQHFLDNGIALCRSPESMKHKSIYHSRPSDFVCPWKQYRHRHNSPDPNAKNSTQYFVGGDNETYEDDSYVANVSDTSALQAKWSSDERESLMVLAKCLPCMLKPCAHNGQCSPIGQLDYECSCPPQYRGKQCELSQNACVAKPCHNGGICEVISEAMESYRCICPANFRGTNCIDRIETCSKNVCFNGGVCEMARGAHRCHCTTGFHGRQCENTFKFCDELNPCVNGGTCIRQPGNKYRCECLQGWSGKHCDRNEDDCLYNKCENGATCVDGINEYVCKCRPGYAGMFCERPTWNSAAHVTRMDKKLPSALLALASSIWQSPEVRQSPIKTRSLAKPRLGTLCAYHQCQNRATCKENQNNMYSCVCRPGFTGQYCERLTSICLPSPHSYLAIVPPSRGALVPRGSISLIFSSHNTDGVLLYYGDMLQTGDYAIPEQYLLAYLDNGYLFVRLSLNESEATEKRSAMQVNNGLSHKAELVIEMNMINLSVDGINGMNTERGRKWDESRPKQVSHLALSYPIYFGGAPADQLEIIRHILKGNQTFGMKGCIQDIHINERQINLARLFGAPVDKITTSDTQYAEKPSPEAQYYGTAIGIMPGCPTDEPTVTAVSGRYAQAEEGTPHETIIHTQGQDMASVGSTLRSCSNTSVCFNRGRCQETLQNGTLTGYNCACPQGYTGRRCELPVAQPCQTSGKRTYLRDPGTNCISVRKLRIRTCSGQCHGDRRPMHSIVQKFSARKYLHKRHGRLKLSNSHKEALSATQSCCQSSKLRHRLVQFTCPSGSGYQRMVRLVKRCTCTPCSRIYLDNAALT